MQCLIIFTNITCAVSSVIECNYYNYHLIWAMMVIITGFIMFVQYLALGSCDVDGWGALWMVCLTFGLETGIVSGCCIAVFAFPAHVGDEPPTAEPIGAQSGIPVQESCSPAPAAEVLPLASSVTGIKCF